MSRQGLGWAVAGVIVLALCAWQVASVYQLQMDHGYSFPPYSTHSAAPSGLAAWHGALAAQPGLTVWRNERDPRRLEDGAGRALIFPAAGRGRDPRTLIEAMERFAASGGHLVIAYAGLPTGLHVPPEVDNGDCPGGDCDPGPAADGLPSESVDTEERWGYTIGFQPLSGERHRPALATAVADVEHAQAGLSIPWYSQMHFTPEDEAWRVVYRRDTLPVVLRRDWGNGRITLLADNFALTNEAMRMHRRPEYLAWLVDGANEVIFDEYYLGMRREPNLMALLRRHHLHYFLLALLAVAGLFAWQASVPLVPRPDAARQARDTAPSRRRAQAEALPALLRRAIAHRDLLPACVRVWSETAGPAREAADRRGALREHVDRLPADKTPAPRELLEAYNGIARALRKGNKP